MKGQREAGAEERVSMGRSVRGHTLGEEGKGRVNREEKHRHAVDEACVTHTVAPLTYHALHPLWNIIVFIAIRS